jgi:hypothetical protein
LWQNPLQFTLDANWVDQHAALTTGWGITRQKDCKLMLAKPALAPFHACRHLDKFWASMLATAKHINTNMTIETY